MFAIQFSPLFTLASITLHVPQRTVLDRVMPGDMARADLLVLFRCCQKRFHQNGDRVSFKIIGFAFEVVDSEQFF